MNDADELAKSNDLCTAIAYWRRLGMSTLTCVSSYLQILGHAGALTDEQHEFINNAQGFAKRGRLHSTTPIQSAQLSLVQNDYGTHRACCLGRKR